MKRTPFVLLLLVVFAALPAAAQVTATGSDTLNVSANNLGNFTFTINSNVYNFGSITSLGVANAGGTESITPSTTATSATYASSATAISWTVASAPPREVRINNTSAGPHTLAWGTADNLELLIPAIGGGVSCGWTPLGTTGDDPAEGCANGQLIHSINPVGRGANDVDGNLQLRVTVNDTDATGANTWVVELTALGS